MLKKAIFLALAASISVAAAAPAMAQPFDHNDRMGAPTDMRGGGGPPGDVRMGGGERGDMRMGGHIDQRIGDLRTRISDRLQQRSIGFRQARNLQTQLRRAQWLEQRYRDQSGGHLNDGQRADLNGRLDRIAAQLGFDRG
jgi:hypothetical protein